MFKWRCRGLFFIFFILSSQAWATETTNVEQVLKENPFSFVKEKKLNFSSDYDYGWVNEGGRKGSWILSTNVVSYAFDNGVIPYLEVDAWDRLNVKNYMVDAGAYFKFKDSSYWRSEVGFGKDATYLPKFQTTQEYQHRFIKNVFWQFGYKYEHHCEGDIHIASPALVYYFKDNYLSMSYNASFTESRGVAQWGIFKGVFSLNNRLNLSIGTAIGERLYDINDLPASQEYGYIIFSGFNLKVTKDADLRLGYSYSREVPDFIKRSIDIGFSIKF